MTSEKKGKTKTKSADMNTWPDHYLEASGTWPVSRRSNAFLNNHGPIDNGKV